MANARIANMRWSPYLRTCAAPGYALQELYLLGKQCSSGDPTAHNVGTHRVRRKSISPLSSRMGRAGPGSSASHKATALAFASRSRSA